MAVKSTGKRAVFLDKDGTLIVDVPYNVDPTCIELVPGAVEALKTLQAAGYRLIVVSNQSGVARGYFPASALEGVEQHIGELLAAEGVRLSGFYTCPHHPEETVERYAVECACRKPEPGMLLQAAEEQGIDLAQSWMLGDILNDVEAGHRAGCRAILVDNGGKTEWVGGPFRQPDAQVNSLPEAAQIITAR